MDEAISSKIILRFPFLWMKNDLNQVQLCIRQVAPIPHVAQHEVLHVVQLDHRVWRFVAGAPVCRVQRSCLWWRLQCMSAACAVACSAEPAGCTTLSEVELYNL